MNPYAPPAVALELVEPVGYPPINPWVRCFAGLVATTGGVFLPVALFPLVTPGLFVWLGWILIACGKRNVHRIGFWWFSAGWNIYIILLLLLLRNGDVGGLDPGMLYTWTHLLVSVVGSLVVASAMLEAKKVGDRESIAGT